MPVLVRLTLPVVLPALEGEKITLKELVWLGFSVSGSDKPLILNPGPLVLAEEIVTLAALGLLRVTVCVLL